MSRKKQRLTFSDDKLLFAYQELLAASHDMLKWEAMFLIWGREVENIQEIWEAIAGIQNARSSCESAAKAIRAKVKRIKGRRLSVRIQKARGRAK
jgi:hypothetical protein